MFSSFDKQHETIQKIVISLQSKKYKKVWNPNWRKVLIGGSALQPTVTRVRRHNRRYFKDCTAYQIMNESLFIN